MSILVALLSLIYLNFTQSFELKNLSHFFKDKSSDFTLFKVDQIQFPKNFIPLQSEVFELQGDKYIYVSFFINPKDFTKNFSHPIYIYRLNKDGTISKVPEQFGNTEHIRHSTTIKTPWGDGIVFADHGVDDPKKNMGGNVLLIVKDSKTQKLVDMTKFLNLKRNYAFNVVAITKRNQIYQDLLIVALNTPFSKPVYLQASSTGYSESSNLLPKDWQEKKICLMTGLALNINHSGNDDVFLGACDRDSRLHPIEKDRIMSWNGKAWDWNTLIDIPKRLKNKEWGTVYLEKADLDNRGVEDIITLTHDYGFHEGLPQILKRSLNSQKIQFTNSEILNWPKSLLETQSYLHKVISIDLDHDGKLDLVGQINYIHGPYPVMPNLFVLMNKSDHWEYSKNPFDLDQNNFIIGMSKVKFKELSKELSKVELFFMTSDGKVLFFRNIKK